MLLGLDTAPLYYDQLYTDWIWCVCATITLARGLSDAFCVLGYTAFFYSLHIPKWTFDFSYSLSVRMWLASGACVERPLGTSLKRDGATLHHCFNYRTLFCQKYVSPLGSYGCSPSLQNQIDRLSEVECGGRRVLRSSQHCAVRDSSPACDTP